MANGKDLLTAPAEGETEPTAPVTEPGVEPAEPGAEPAPAPEPTADPDAEPEAESADYSEISLPEGSKLSAERLEEVVALAKENGWPPEVAAEMLAGEEAVHVSIDTTYNEMADAWAEEVENDPDIGGAKLPETVEAARRGLLSAGDAGKALLELAARTRLGNMPLFLKAWSAVGRKKMETKSLLPANAVQAGQESESPAQRWTRKHPNSPVPPEYL